MKLKIGSGFYSRSRPRAALGQIAIEGMNFTWAILRGSCLGNSIAHGMRSGTTGLPCLSCLAGRHFVLDDTLNGYFAPKTQLAIGGNDDIVEPVWTFIGQYDPLS